MIYEIRNYHFDPKRFPEYKGWVRDRAGAFLGEKLDVVGFWLGTDLESEIHGEPMDALGSANVTWILRWKDMAQRDELLPAVLGSPEWTEIFSSVPGGLDSYVRRESKFMDSL